FFFFFQAEDGIRDRNVTGVQTCALPISDAHFFIKALVINLYCLLTFEYVESYLNLYFHHLQERNNDEIEFFHYVKIKLLVLQLLHLPSMFYFFLTYKE